LIKDWLLILDFLKNRIYNQTMSSFKEVLRIGFVVGTDITTGTVIGKFVDSWFPLSIEDANYKTDAGTNYNLIFKDIALTIAQSTATVFLALAIRNDLLGENYIATDQTNGNILFQSLFFGQTNLWRRIDSIYDTLITDKVSNMASTYKDGSKH